MGYICDFCGDQRSMVYCWSDAACLCLSCDRNVHSANALSRRHSRTLICERCNSQPALVRCTEESVSLCQNCDWMGHGASTSAASHKRQTLNCYSGCPSASELSSIWSFVLDLPSAAVGESACEQEMGLMSIAENSTESARNSQKNNNRENVSDTVACSEVGAMDKSDSLVILSSAPAHNLATQVVGQMPASVNSTLPKLYCHGTKGPGDCEDDDFYGDFDMDEMDLNLENYDELFGLSLNHSEEIFKNGGIDSLFGARNMSRAQELIAPEGSSIGQINALQQPACSTAASVDSIMSTKTEPIVSFVPKQAQSNLSFSGVTGESNAGDYQDCGASLMIPMGEPPWCSPGPESSSQSVTRSDAVMRYKEKKKARK